MAENNVDFTAPWEYGDIVFLVEDRKIYANKHTICMSSPVMAAMFKGNFREKNATEVPLPGKVFTDFLELMRVLHPLNKYVDGSNIYELLALANEYQMAHVTIRGEKLLLSLPPSIKHLVLADKYSLSNLHDYCTEFAKSTTLCALKEMEDFFQIEPKTLVEILTHKVEELEPSFTKPEPVPEPSKQVICQLMSSPPSINNLVQADLYSMPELHKSCIKYAKNIPLSTLKQQKGFAEICSTTLIELLTERVEQLEQNKLTIYKYATFKHPSSKVCPKCGYYICTRSTCDTCKDDIVKNIQVLAAATT